MKNSPHADPPSSYYKYWGKTSESGEYHLLPYHCLDVAAVGAVWLQSDSVIQRLFESASGLNARLCQAWLLFFLALHDFGKLDIRFQLKAPDVMHLLRPEVDDASAEKEDSYYHGPYGWEWFCRESTEFIDDADLPHWGKWMEAVCGHHGSISLGRKFSLPFAEVELIKFDRHARNAFIKDLEVQFLHPEGLSLSKPPPPAPDLLAGFCSVCDWIGSNQLFFKPVGAERNLDEYWKETLERAKQALEHSGVIGRPLAIGGMKELYAAYEPRQVQTLIDQLPVEPGLTLIEAPTGSGKTEAALAYASRLLAAGLADSIIFALPTQATANAMFERLEEVAPRLFHGSTNILLAHGRAKYNKLYTELKETTHLTAQGREEAAAQCVEWLSASRKRVFLGQAGICTIDQVFLSVLPVRHQFVRAFGIRKSVLIIDEVHAYDAYMYGLMESVLRGQQIAGGSAILLSATLPHQQKQILLGSQVDNKQPTKEPYPQIIHQSNQGKTKQFVPDMEHQPTPATVATVSWKAVGMLPSQEQQQAIISAAIDGALVGIVCNLVADAQKLADILSEVIKTLEANVELDLFHSRYRFKDRQDKEKAVMSCYGKNAPRSKGRILVATQVIEQSLDLDFDWLITQLCPADLLFQRIGRLHRHPRDNRPAAFSRPLCTVIVPADGDYLLHKLVYGHTQILWRTQRMLQKAPEIHFPAAYRDWIEKVYATTPWKDEPAEISEEADKFRDGSEGKFYSAKTISVAGGQPLPDTEGAAGHLTRDGEMSLTVVPIIAEKGHTLLDGENLDKVNEGDRDELINMNAIGVPSGWRKQLPIADDNGWHWLCMKSSDVQRNRYESMDRVFRYSPNTGLELVDNREEQ
jgi:CRISPR-associated endonuclease/helicase Cas3